MMTGFQRQQILNRLGDIAMSITEAPDYEGFRADRLTHYTAEVGDILSPFVAPLTQPDRLNRDTRFLVEQAWEINRLIATSRVQWGFRWPHAGERFNPTMMTPVYPGKDAQDLHRDHWRVGLVVSPIITMTRDTGNGPASIHELHVSDVVCMQ
jgi:hypothetical protein